MRTDVDAERVLDLNRQFHDDVEAIVYDQRMGVRHDKQSVVRTIDELERVLGEPLPANAHVVDLGAGTGNVAVKLAIDGRFASVTAVDISRGMLNQAAAAAQQHGCHVDTLVSHLDVLPFDDNSVDLIVGCAMLHHMPEPARLLREVHRVLRPSAAAVFIGEPSTWGERITHVVKLPLLVPLRVYRYLSGRPAHVWEHDMIDVHTFGIGDIRDVTCDFDRVRIQAEGFLEPIVDQAILVPVQRVLGERTAVSAGCATARRWLHRADAWSSNRILPKSLLASIKFACWK